MSAKRCIDFLNNCFFSILKVTGILLLKLFFHIEAKSDGRIPLSGPLIVAANHFSYMDPVALQSIFPRRISFMMTELFYEGRGKWLFQLLRCICVRERGSNITALKEGIDVLKKNGVIGIFPEGSVSREGCLQEGISGIGFLVKKSGASVIPAFIFGTYEALPKGAKLPKPSRIKIIFGKPMLFKDGESGSQRQTITEITGQIMEQIEKLSFTHPANPLEMRKNLKTDSSARQKIPFRV
ncbi:MAG: 1-acyl-sn-glycerol-3-phosphate acyltransferase [Planctomycetes bacterium]|nr:1-acyl-sn-glycerol-3-phosphate acyltransferase [Planctomycetota bacterium]